MGESSSFLENLGGNMKPEYLYSIATDLGLQFDGEARVMYGEREGFLLVIEGRSNQECIYHFTQCETRFRRRLDRR